MSLRYTGAWLQDGAFNPLAATSPIPGPNDYNLNSWGINGGGQLGLGDTTNRSSPSQVGSLVNWSKVSNGWYCSYAIKADGSLWSWGANSAGQLGLGNVTYYSSPKQVGALTNWLIVSGGYFHAAAIKTDGTLWTWGQGATIGALGLGNTTNYSSPKQVGALTNWSTVSSGYQFSIAIKTNGTIWGWGYNGAGGLGIGNTTNYSSPKQIGALTTWSKVNCLAAATIAIKTDGTIWSWGQNNFGQSGLGNMTVYSSPMQVGALTNWLKLSSGGYYSCHAIKTDGTLWGWGQNTYGAIGNSSTTNLSSPVQIGALTDWDSVTSGSSIFTTAVKTNGTLWSWGGNSQGQLGLGNITAYSSPKQVGSSTKWYRVSSAVNSTISLIAPPVPAYTQYSGAWTTSQATDAVASGTWAVPPVPYLYSWGNNSAGELGLGNTVARSSPNQVGSLTTWSFIGNGINASFVMAIKTDGTLWTWGGGGGAKGLGNSTAYSSPKQVGALTNWANVSQGSTFTIAVKTNGTLWAWGNNTYAQLGNGNVTSYSSPIQIGSLTDWSSVVCDSSATMAIKTDGTLWGWGGNYWGNLGISSSGNYISSPTQVGSLTNWAYFTTGGSQTFAVKTNGTLWAWGYNGYGNLATGNTTNYSSPVQIGALTNWGKITCASLQTAHAIKTDGTLWAWGYNATVGLVGNNSLTNVTSPVQIGSLTNWSTIQHGYGSSYAIKTDGTLWVWGDNTNGRLGLGNTTNYSSPKQVGTLTSWLTTAGGYQSAYGIARN